MFFDLKFYSHSNPGRYLVAHFPCVAKGQIDTVFSNVDDIDNFDIVIASVVTDRQVEFTADEVVEVVKESFQ